MNEDPIELLLYLAKQQIKGAESRDDSLIHLITKGTETITATDAEVSINVKAHPVKWDQFTWDLATWG
jgi:hypothetical protein